VRGRATQLFADARDHSDRRGREGRRREGQREQGQQRDRIPDADAAQRRKALSTRASPPLKHPLHWARVAPDRIAYRMPGSRRAVAYRELAETARRGARTLREAGLRVGDGIAVLAENRVESLQVFWAAQIAGLYYTAISTQFQRDEVQHILD